MVFIVYLKMEIITNVLAFRCKFHNFSRNKECYECQTERPRGAGRVSDRGDSRRPGQWDRETSRSSYGRTEERGRPAYEERGRPAYEERGRSSYEERGRPSYGQSSYGRSAEWGRPSFSRSEERSRPSRDGWERPSQNDREEGLERFERPRSAEAGGRRKHEEWKPTRTQAKPSRFNFDISDDSDEDFVSTISSDEDYKDIEFGDENEDSEPEERISTRGRGAPEKGFRGGRSDDTSEGWNSGVSRMRSRSEPPSRGRNRRELELSSSSGEEDFEDIDFGDEDDDEERAVSSSRGGRGREFTRGRGGRGGRGSFDSGAGRSRAPRTRDGGSMESRGTTPRLSARLS